MESVLLYDNSKVNLKLLTDLAKKIGVSFKYLTEEEKEDIAMFRAIEKGRTNTFVDTDEYLKKIKK